jgi:hypothetical protein
MKLKTMSNIKEQIRQEIERLKKHSESAKKEWIDEGYNQNAFAEDCRITSFDNLLDSIDSLPEEQSSDDLNKLIQKWDRIDINTVLKVKVKATGKVIDGFYDGRGHFDHFIDHDVFDRYSIDEVELMPEEKSSEDLEEAAEEYAYRGVPDELKPLMKPLADEIIKNFIAAAGWQKSQILKDAVEAKIYGYDDGSFELIASWLDIPNNSIYKDGDKVKIIIVKED